jgi:UDP-glucose 4,6-dehydratase
VRNSLSHLPDFVAACLECFRRKLPTGIYNLTNGGSVTTREVAHLLRNHDLAKREFEFFRDEVEFMKTAAIAPRSSCVLDNSKAIRAGLGLPSVTAALEQAMNSWQWEANTPLSTTVVT